MSTDRLISGCARAHFQACRFCNYQLRLVCRERGDPELRADKTLLPRVRGRSRGGSDVTKLEGELDGQLDAARTSAAQKRIADADVAGGDDLIGAVADFAAIGWRSKPARATLGTVRVDL